MENLNPFTASIENNLHTELKLFSDNFDLPVKYSSGYKITYSIPEAEKVLEYWQKASDLIKEKELMLDVYTQSWSGTIKGVFTTQRVELVIEHKFFGKK